MASKRHRNHLKAAREASVASFKKRKLEASSLSNSGQRKIDDNKLNTIDTSNTRDSSDTEGEPGTWFWNESDSDSEKEMM